MCAKSGYPSLTYGENPLQSQRASPGPLIAARIVGQCSASHDDAANGPTHLQRCRAGTSKSKGNNLTGICWGVGDEETPWDTLQRLTDNEKGK